MEKYTELEERYLVKQRVNEILVETGSPQKAILKMEQLEKECEDNWSKYSYDCVGHAITCARLIIRRLKEINLTLDSDAIK